MLRCDRRVARGTVGVLTFAVLILVALASSLPGPTDSPSGTQGPLELPSVPASLRNRGVEIERAFPAGLPDPLQMRAPAAIRRPMERREVAPRVGVARLASTGRWIAALSSRSGADQLGNGFAATNSSTAGKGVGLVPDTQIAAGRSYLMEMVNRTWSLWSKTGQLKGQGSIDAFFDLPAGYRSADPQILYDALSGRWFASCVAVDVNGNSKVYVAASRSSDPKGEWSMYRVASKTGIVMDQPMLGVSSDKVVLAWDDYAGVTFGEDTGGQFTGQETWVLEKRDFVTGRRTLHQVGFGLDKNRFRLVPARSLSSSSTEYLVYNRGTTAATARSVLGVVAINGTPAKGRPSWSEKSVFVTPITKSPPAVQPDSGPVIATTPFALLSAVWQRGALWTASNDACIPSGDSTTRSCLRLIKVDTLGRKPRVRQDFDVGQVGAYLDYPAVTLDSAGNLFAVFSESSARLYPSVAVVAQNVRARPKTVSAPIVIAAGQGVYDCGNCLSENGSGVRWGDYSGAAADPDNRAVVWLAGEYALSRTDRADWGTAIGPFTYARSGRAASPAALMPARTSTTAGRSTPPVPTPVPEQESSRAAFRVLGVRAQASVRPDWRLASPPTRQFRVGQSVTLAIYLRVTQLPRAARLGFTWLITHDGPTAAHHGKHVDLTAGRTVEYWGWWSHAFEVPGVYLFRGSATLDGRKETQSVTFQVSS